MSKRWKPDNNYYYIDSYGEVHAYQWADDFIDTALYEFGNCFETREQAEAAAAKIKELLLGMSGAAKESRVQLPKLTAEVFDRPDCPKWAKYAAVDEDGTVALFEQRPTIALVGKWWDRGGKYCPLDGRYDNLNWRNSLIERPAKLPDWCKVDAMGWHKRCGYFKVTYIDDVSKRVDIQQVGEKSRGYFSFHTICNETVQARPRPYNDSEMQGLVGKVLELDGNRDLVTSYDNEDKEIYAEPMWMNSVYLLSNGYTIDGKPCLVLEHLEGDTWVEDSTCKD